MRYIRGTRDFDPKIAAQIIEMVAVGDGLKTVCDKLGMPRRTVRIWAAVHPEFDRELTQARRDGYEYWADEIMEIADSVRASDSPAAVNAARLAVDSRKWILSKMRPELYGDKVELTGAGGTPLLVSPEQQIPRLMQVLAVLMPGTANSELHQLATSMAQKLTQLEAPKNGSGKGSDED
jgi:hypothetical protein